MFVAICIFIILITTIIAFFTAKENKLQYIFKSYPQIPKVLIAGYIIFLGCFDFPISSEKFPITFLNLYTLIVGYGIVSSALSIILGPHKTQTVYIATLSLTAVGMLLRYLLEFGEVSNIYNFTIFNIVSYLLIIPAAVTTVYCVLSKKLPKHNLHF